MTGFQRSLLAWYEVNGRDLPWRRNRDPYSVWVSEIMCQQTTIAAVLPYFERWMGRFSSVESLSVASEDEVLSYWQGLGYYSRGRNLLAGAKMVVVQGWPEGYSGWKRVPGVGDYTAAAVASICLGEDVAVVDGNVERVFARVCADGSVGSARKTAAQKWANATLVRGRAGNWNQAVMELGALVCRPKNPDCGACPVSEWCKAFDEGRVGELPAASVKAPLVELNHSVWVPVWKGKFGVRRVPEGRWWQGMWEFPREDSEEALEAVVGSSARVKLGSFRHVVTQHKIWVEVSCVEVEGEGFGLTWVEREELDGLAMPAPMRRVIKMLEQNESQGKLFAQ